MPGRPVVDRLSGEEGHGLLQRIEIGLIIGIHRTLLCRNHLIILVAGQELMLHVRLGIGERPGHSRIGIDHGRQLFVEILLHRRHFCIEFFLDLLILQHTLKKNIAPVIGHAPLPGRVIGGTPNLLIQPVEGPVAVPVDEVEGTAV